MYEDSVIRKLDDSQELPPQNQLGYSGRENDVTTTALLELCAFVANADSVSDARAMRTARAWVAALEPKHTDWLTIISLTQVRSEIAYQSPCRHSSTSERGRFSLLTMYALLSSHTPTTPVPTAIRQPPFFQVSPRSMPPPIGGSGRNAHLRLPIPFTRTALPTCPFARSIEGIPIELCVQRPPPSRCWRTGRHRRVYIWLHSCSPCEWS
jgi:hypothetical protein